MSTWVAALVAAAAISLTYLFCVRPMMRGGCAMRGSRCVRHGEFTAADREIAEMREELRVLRAQTLLHRQSRPPPTHS